MDASYLYQLLGELFVANTAKDKVIAEQQNKIKELEGKDANDTD